MRILTDTPFLALRGDIILDPVIVAHHSLNALCRMPATHQSDIIQLLSDVPDNTLHLRLTTCLTITQAALVVLSPSTTTIRTTTCSDGMVYTLPTRTPSFAHIARTRSLPPHEYARRIQLLTHPQLNICIALAQTYGSINRALVAEQLRITTTAATSLLKNLTPLFYPTDASAKHFVYDAIAHRAIICYPTEATSADALIDPRHHLPEVVRRYSNHLGKINQLPVKLSDRIIVLRYLAQQLPDAPITEPQINAAILTHVAFVDYATARRDMVDLGFVTRTANGSLYQRIDDTSN